MTAPRVPRYRFGELVLSPGRRLLSRAGEPISLPPRYLDLLLLLVAERHRVVSRDEIHRLVWGGVAVTDGAFTQAIRTLRRALGDDDPREPRYIRTAARHGYQFVFPEVREEDDATALATTPATVAHGAPAGSGSEPEDSREAAREASHPRAREDDLAARELRSPTTGEGASLRGAAVAGLLGGVLGGATSGVVASLLLGTLLVLAGGGHWPLVPVLSVVGAGVGAWGGSLVGAGISLGAVTPRWRRLAMVGMGAAGGGLAGAMGHLLVGWTMSELLGHGVTALGGAFEGVVLGGAVASGIALTASGERGAGGSGRAAVPAAALCGAVAAGVLAVLGARLAGISLDAIADALKGARIMAPLGTYLGEPPPLGQRGAGPATRLAVSLLEGGFFGAGMAWGLRRLRVTAGSERRGG